MSWAVGYDEHNKRDVGYGVPAKCDHPDCDTDINRGLGYVCGGEVYGGEHGCGLFFCGDHMIFTEIDPNNKFSEEAVELCERCQRGQDRFKPSPDVELWLRHKLGDQSWADWRNQDPQRLVNLVAELHAIDSMNKSMIGTPLASGNPPKGLVQPQELEGRIGRKPNPWLVPQYRRELPKISRNDPCHCGSGKKFKRCCHG